MDWEAIYGLMEDAIYGGRVDNRFDLRVLRTYLTYENPFGKFPLVITLLINSGHSSRVHRCRMQALGER